MKSVIALIFELSPIEIKSFPTRPAADDPSPYFLKITVNEISHPWLLKVEDLLELNLSINLAHGEHDALSTHVYYIYLYY